MWYQDIIQTADFLLQELGTGLSKILSILFRLGLLYLFFWYSIASISELWSHDQRTLAVAAVATVSLAAVLCASILVRACLALHPRADTGLGSMTSFVSFNLPWIALVALATWYGHTFGAGLLHFTQLLLKKLLGGP
jgi:hypothetical protein